MARSYQLVCFFCLSFQTFRKSFFQNSSIVIHGLSYCLLSYDLFWLHEQHFVDGRGCLQAWVELSWSSFLLLINHTLNQSVFVLGISVARERSVALSKTRLAFGYSTKTCRVICVTFFARNMANPPPLSSLWRFFFTAAFDGRIYMHLNINRLFWIKWYFFSLNDSLACSPLAVTCYRTARSWLIELVMIRPMDAVWKQDPKWTAFTRK